MEDERRRVLLATAREQLAARAFGEAEKALKEILAAHAGFADVWSLLGQVHHAGGQLDEAAGAFGKALALNPTYTDAALNLAITLNDLGRYAEARQVYTAAMKRTQGEPRSLDPFVKGKLANMHADLGAAYAECGLFPEAIREYGKALELCPTFADLRTRLGSVYRDHGDLPAAQRELEIVKTTHPQYLPARVALGNVLWAQAHVPEAIREWEAVLAADPKNRAARTYLTVVKGREAGVVRPDPPPPVPTEPISATEAALDEILAGAIIPRDDT
jgi:tetratricopeptide (TPR) repeat protein